LFIQKIQKNLKTIINHWNIPTISAFSANSGKLIFLHGSCSMARVTTKTAPLFRALLRREIPLFLKTHGGKSALSNIILSTTPPYFYFQNYSPITNFFSTFERAGLGGTMDKTLNVSYHCNVTQQTTTLR
jgi:hypothetical protein